jgi:putative acetyltransferase
MEVRSDDPQDLAAIHNVNFAAFGRAYEADLVDRLRGVASIFSVVALIREIVVGHIFCSPVADV